MVFHMRYGRLLPKVPYMLFLAECQRTDLMQRNLFSEECFGGDVGKRREEKRRGRLVL